MGQQLEITKLNYLNKDFKGFKDKLNGFARTYFPEISNDFNESSPGQMFIEMSAYVGDVLSFYIDNQLRESLLLHAQERSNVSDIATGMGYKSIATAPASVTLDLFLLLPTAGTGETSTPDWRYAPIVQEGLVANSGEASSNPFYTLRAVDFRTSSSLDPTDVSVYKIDADGNPESYLLKKQVQAKSGGIKYKKFSFTDPKKYDSLLFPERNIIEFLDCRDLDNNKWYEVDYLSQNHIYEEVQNTKTIDPYFANMKDDTPYLLKIRKTGRRYTTKLTDELRTKVLFGAGSSNIADEIIIPNPNNLGMHLPYGNVSAMDNSWDPSNAMYTRAYGQAPSNTVLEFKYVVGGGLKDNVRAGTIREIGAVMFSLDRDGLNSPTVQFVKKSLAVNNQEPATGGKGSETVEEIRQNAMGFYAAQNRTVTREDFISRVYSMPGRFGNIAKAYIIPDEQTSHETDQIVKNPLALNLYVLSYDKNGNLTNPNSATKENLRNYLSKFRILTDAINIKNGYIINLGVDFSIIPLPGYNNNTVLLRCVKLIGNIFRITKWQFNEPIFLANIATQLDSVEGVQSVQDININCKHALEAGYSGNFYDIGEATKNKIVYPSQDPAIFEIKYPPLDIRGKIVSY